MRTLPACTFPLKLTLDPVMTPPTTLAPVTIPVTLLLVPVITPPTTLAPVTIPDTLLLVPVMTPPTTLAPVMTPVTLTVVPECNVALTLAPPKTLAPVIFPVLFMYPAILAPVDVTVTVVAPAAVSVKLPVLTTLPANVLAADLVTVIPGKIVGKLVLVGAAGVNAASTLTMAICVLFTYRLVIKCGEPPESFTDPGIAPAVPSLLV